MKKLIILFALFASSCNPFENISEVKKREHALKNPRFKELPEEEMYAFLNEVYLPRLDSLKIPRNIVIHPSVYEPRVFDELLLPEQAKWYSDRKIKINLSNLSPPPLVGMVDSTYFWDKEKLGNVVLVEDIDEWMSGTNDVIFLSKPFRDTKKGTVIIEEFYTNLGCCTCSPEQLFFLKTDSGWTQIPKY